MKDFVENTLQYVSNLQRGNLQHKLFRFRFWLEVVLHSQGMNVFLSLVYLRDYVKLNINLMKFLFHQVWCCKINLMIKMEKYSPPETIPFHTKMINATSRCKTVFLIHREF